ncbi:hypothetical protein ALP58_103014 [Pseudomonas savastanoi]|uniref:Uncharacterized protein n=2 Tax=Pseudomonas syringae group TaxID=136849 RepID=A0A0P9QGW7_PSESX|nr:Unknown protein sequence [Pseudomonas amygdali pv. myricae]KPW97211.1 Unknown protein sequence [Pseudomonas syringae pv. castaneae]KPX91396.1 hypothetical protein ALO62_103576 [Pseudomonas amygdali pv. myricae]RMS85399.1 hypothetical protein ALP58_103014 [Pseudomonas savastanoi]
MAYLSMEKYQEPCTLPANWAQLTANFSALGEVSSSKLI